MSDPLPRLDTFRCPGESYTISRADHLGRLAAFYEKCRECPHREDADTLAPRRRRQLAAVAAQRSPALQFGAESISGVLLNELTSTAAENLAAEFGRRIGQPPFAESAPKVMLAFNGRSSALELLAPLSRGLRWAGCHVIHLGPVSVGRLAQASVGEPSAAALYLGNESGHQATASLKFWGPSFVPFSSPGHLDFLRGAEYFRGDRPSRHVGSQTRQHPDHEYLARWKLPLRNLRPLRIVCDIRNEPLGRDLAELLEPTACQVRHERLPKRATRSRLAARLRWQNASAEKAYSRRSPSEWFAPGSADLGIVIDQDGEAIRVFDEAAQPVSPPALLALFADSRPTTPECQSLLADAPLPPSVADVLRRAGWAIRLVGKEPNISTRQSIDALIRESDVDLSVTMTGRFQFGPTSPAADALVTLVELLKLLNNDTRALSQRLVATLAPRRAAS